MGYALALFFFFIWTSLAPAASILGIHSDKTKIIVGLDAQEMAALELNVEVPIQIELDGQTHFLFATPHHLNPLRRIVVLDLSVKDSASEEREFLGQLKVKQKLQFLPSNHRTLASPSLQSVIGAFRFDRDPVIMAGGGVLYDAFQTESNGGKSSSRGVGSFSNIVGWMTLIPEQVQAQFAFKSVDVRSSKNVTLGNQENYSAKDRYETTELIPQLAFLLVDDWTLGLGYNWLAIKSTESDQVSALTYNYTFSQPVLSLKWLEPRSEKTWILRGGDKGQGTLANRNFLGTPSQTKPMTLLGSFEFQYRSLKSSRFSWYSGGGVMFEQFKRSELQQKPEPTDLLLWHLGIERYLEKGEKLEMHMSYQGGGGRTLTRLQQVTHAVALGLHWEKLLASHWVWTLGSTVEVGQKKGSSTPETSDGTAPQSAVSQTAGVFVHIQKEFAPVKSKRPHRRG